MSDTGLIITDPCGSAQDVTFSPAKGTRRVTFYNSLKSDQTALFLRLSLLQGNLPAALNSGSNSDTGRKGLQQRATPKAVGQQSLEMD